MKKYLYIVLILIAVIIVSFSLTSKSELLRGRLSLTRNNPEVFSASSNRRKYSAKEIIPIEKDENTTRLTSKNYKYTTVRTKWRPGFLRKKEDNKRLIKIFPFPSVYKKAETILQQTSGTIAASSTTKWENAGVTGAGVVESVDYSQKKYTHLLMGTEASGLYQSFNLGESWEKIDFSFYNINQVAIDPNSDNHYIVLANQIYLFETQDGGKEWKKIYTFKDQAISYYGNNSNIAWNNENIFVSVDNKTLISTNNGTNWSESELPLVNGDVQYYGKNVKIKKSGFGIYVMFYYNKTANSIDSSVFITKDYGKSWKKILEKPVTTIGGFDITEDGKDIVLGMTSNKDGTAMLARSINQGNNWKYSNIKFKNEAGYELDGGDIQDVLIDNQNYNKVMLFRYMSGIYELFDDTTFSNNLIEEYEVLSYPSPIYNSMSILIEPEDLKFGNAKTINIPGGGLVSDQTLLLLPTDQGLFTYNNVFKNLKTISNNVYLGDTGIVTATSCPRIYSGLWHFGQAYIGSNNKAFIQQTSEAYGVSTGEDLDCNTPVINDNGDYLPQGVMMDEAKSGWIWDNIDLVGSINLYQYYDGWWYGYGSSPSNNWKNILIRFNKELNKTEVVRESNNAIKAFFIEKKNSGTNYWLLDESKILWKSTDLKEWVNYKNLSNLKLQFTTAVYPINLYIDSDLVVISGNQGGVASGSSNSVSSGFFVSSNGGGTWNTFFPFALSSNIVRDKKGNLYVGLMPHENTHPINWEQNIYGVWRSKNNGITWETVGQGAEKSWVSGLAIVEKTNTLYASTRGESLLKIQLE